MQWNTGGLAVGIFNSKNSFGFVQALLIQVGAWVLLDHGERGLMRALAFIGVGRRGHLDRARFWHSICTSSRVVFLCADALLTAILCRFLIVFGDEPFQTGLQLTGKSADLSRRAEFWDVAKPMMQEHPIGALDIKHSGNPGIVRRRFVTPDGQFWGAWFS
jgi:hypothetical protein